MGGIDDKGVVLSVLCLMRRLAEAVILPMTHGEDKPVAARELTTSEPTHRNLFPLQPTCTERHSTKHFRAA